MSGTMKRWDVSPNLAGSWIWRDARGYSCVTQHIDCRSRAYARAFVLLSRAQALLRIAHEKHAQSQIRDRR
jgi:hypothetical protein